MKKSFLRPGARVVVVLPARGDAHAIRVKNKKIKTPIKTRTLHLSEPYDSRGRNDEEESEGGGQVVRGPCCLFPIRGSMDTVEF
jgi:hypothetical protein